MDTRITTACGAGTQTEGASAERLRSGDREAFTALVREHHQALRTLAACIVGDAFSMSPTLEKMYKASGQPVPHSKRILELNPEHPLVSGLREAQAANDNAENLTETAQLLYGMALLAEGGELSDPAHFTRLLADRLARTV